MRKRTRTMLAVPKEPVLHTYTNGQTVIRYPVASKSKPGKVVARVFKLGFGIGKDEQERQLTVFRKEHATTGNGKGRELMVVPQPKKGRKGKTIDGDTVTGFDLQGKPLPTYL